MATYVIVGGVAGGATAAARLRRMDEQANIIVLERGEYVSFANCGLPYYVGDVITDRDSLLVSTPEKLHQEYNIDVRTRHEALSIDREAKTVLVRDLDSQHVFDLPYDKLLLSPGAKPLVPPLPGVDLPGVYSLRTIPDTDTIRARVDDGSVRSAAVIGGGFIGLEMAENLTHRGVDVTLVEMLDQVLATLDPEMAAPVHEHLEDNGVHLALGDGLARIDQTFSEQLAVTLASGARYVVDMVILAVGVRPESDLARDAGLEVGPKGHIIVDPHMRTSDPDIYSVGDAVQVLHAVTGSSTAVPLAGPANRQARVAADHMTGSAARYEGAIGTSIVKVFGLTVGSTGANAKTLQREAVPFLASVTHSQDHVGYYPGATSQSVKILYAPEDGRLLGAQVVGQNAVDRTIDIVAVALRAGMTVYDLENLELAYAPPYGAAKDPVNIAGYVASNRLRGESDIIEWDALAGLEAQGYGILDVRTPIEYALGHIPGALNIPNTELRQRLDELDRTKKWVIYCAVGQRAYIAQRLLAQHGFKVVNLTGGYTTYRPAAAQTQREESSTARTPVAVSSPATLSVPDGAAVSREETIHTATPNVPGRETPVPAPSVGEVITLDACGLQCPGPIMSVYKRMHDLEEGQVLAVKATDPGFARDISAWSQQTGNRLLSVDRDNGTILATIQKGSTQPKLKASVEGHLSDAKTIVVFSGDLDRALASFVIANGALAMGQEVTMFFTFWGLTVLRKSQPQRVKKNLIERMFGWMLPRGPEHLSLSKLHMGGLGTRMIKAVMKSKNIDPLPALMASAQESGARLVACQMSMDMMGIKPEELTDGVEIGGVATYIGATDQANASLFI